METNKMLERMISEPAFGYEGLSKADLVWCFRNAGTFQKMWMMGYLLGGYVASGKDNWKQSLCALDKESDLDLKDTKEALNKELIEIRRKNITAKGPVEVWYDYKDRPAYLYGSEERGWILRFYGYADRELLTEIQPSREAILNAANLGGYIAKGEEDAEAESEERCGEEDT